MKWFPMLFTSNKWCIWIVYQLNTNHQHARTLAHTCFAYSVDKLAHAHIMELMA
jgi:hypothetical protein